ncbi:unnamed protein product [Didymodactylos carnosus]|uniref:Ammonium transporter n=1 Tax=Didymodactylos carnosus TaxID=1234261 RepID=A0A8S2GFF9_9BILA|nr:unnamed protein product [Didymodactylos carnosus]CAF3510599.1 unnamed protein product [Didymodactylos carnosus]
MMTSTALVYMMTPALAFFYGGLVDIKNILNQLFLSIICMGIVTTQWCLFGFSFTFGPGNNAFGSFNYGALRFPDQTDLYGSNGDPINSPTFSLLTFTAYEAAFAVITPALISGAIVGRMKLVPYLIFIFLWTTCCYDPLARWIFFSGGWLHTYGTLDFAGGTVVHISSGVSGLVASLVLGKRHDYDPKKIDIPHNLPFTVLGTGLLWIGWIGFNGGSSLAANGVAALAMVNTNTAAASSLMTWVIIDAVRGTVSISGACSAIVVGLVTITPAAGYVQPGWALLMGVIGAVCVYCALKVKKRFLYFDDTLDTFSCHGIGGIVGGFMTGLFCQAELNSGGYNGAFYGNPRQMWLQLAGILTGTVFSAACTAGILLPMHLLFGIKLDIKDQVVGMDRVAHGESWAIEIITSNEVATNTPTSIHPDTPQYTECCPIYDMSTQLAPISADAPGSDG